MDIGVLRLRPTNRADRQFRRHLAICSLILLAHQFYLTHLRESKATTRTILAANAWAHSQYRCEPETKRPDPSVTTLECANRRQNCLSLGARIGIKQLARIPLTRAPSMAILAFHLACQMRPASLAGQTVPMSKIKAQKLASRQLASQRYCLSLVAKVGQVRGPNSSRQPRCVSKQLDGPLVGQVAEAKYVSQPGNV